MLRVLLQARQRARQRARWRARRRERQTNTRATVVDIVYTDGGYDPDDTLVSPIVVVDFPSYTGRPWDPDHPTWVPIVPVERRCDHSCCSRTGIPLWPGKAGSVHSFQGLTVGDTKQYSRIVFKWDKGAEGRWLEAFNVGASRAMAPHNIALAGNMTNDDLNAIANGGGWKAQRIKVAHAQARIPHHSGVAPKSPLAH